MESVSAVSRIVTKQNKNDKYIVFETTDEPFIAGVKYRIIYETSDSYVLSHNGEHIKIDKSLENITYKTGAIVRYT